MLKVTLPVSRSKMLPLPRRALENMKRSPTLTTLSAEVTASDFQTSLPVFASRHQTKRSSVLLRTVEAADVELPIAGAERAFGGDVVVVGLPEDVPGLRVDAAGEAVVFHGQAASAR
jgi:hypothetical protein